MIVWLRSASLRAWRIRATAVALGASMMLTACAQQTAYDPSLSPAQNQLRAANAHFNTTVGEGAAAGALLGGIAGLALGGRNRAGAALAGAAAGGLLGGGAGYLVARNNLTRASTEAEFTDAISKSAAEAEQYRRYADASGQIADQAYAEAARLRSMVRSQQITQAQYRAGIAKYQTDLDQMNVLSVEFRKTAATFRQNSQVANGPDRGQFQGLATDVDASARRQEATAARLSRLLAGGEA